MQKHSRALRVAGLLAVGFVVGRWSVELTEEQFRGQAAPSVSPVVAADRPITVPVDPGGAEAIVDEPSAAPAVPDAAAPMLVETPTGVSVELIAPTEEPSPSRSAAQVVGTWYAETSSGTRLCVLNADGTGTVDAKLSWLASLFYGERLFLNVDWVVDDEAETMIHTVTSGTPTDKVTALTNDYGTVKEYRIDGIADDTLVLIDPGDGEVITWHRRESGTTLD